MSVTIASVLPPVDGMVTSRQEGMVTPQQQSGAAAEQQMFDYLVRSHLEALAAPAVHLANPAALAGETLARLKGFVERANQFDKAHQYKASHTAPAGFDEPFGMHPGPALASLAPDADELGGPWATEKLPDLSGFMAELYTSTIHHEWTLLTAHWGLGLTHQLNALLNSR